MSVSTPSSVRPVVAAAPAHSQPRARVFAAFCIGAAIAATVILASSRGKVEHMSFGDGLLERAVAARITAAPADVNPVVATRGSSLRYGRIGLPAAIWIGAAGKPLLMRYSHPLVIVLAAGFASAAAAALLPGAGALGSFAPFLAVGFVLAVAGGYSEVLAAAFGMWAVVFVQRKRWWLSAALLALAMLTKENAAAILAGVAAWTWLRNQRRGAWILATSLIPAAAWYAFMWARYGSIPLLDPYLRVTTDTVGTPGIALVRSILHPARAGSLATLIAHVAVGVVAFMLLRRKTVFAFVGAAAALQMLSAAPFAWRYIGDAMRISTFLEIFTLLAIAAYFRRDWAEGFAHTG